MDGPAPVSLRRVGWRRNLWWFTIGGLIDWWQWRKVPWWEIGARVSGQFNEAAEEARHSVREDRTET
jgi:hypothetical protein